jgi:methanethiol S-methyltransferase
MRVWEVPMKSDYILLALLWTLYCVLHSTLIAIPVTTRLKEALGARYRFYRLFFNAFSLIALVPLVMYSHSARFASQPFFAWSGYLRIPQYCLFFIAAVLMISGARHYSLVQFLGISQIRQKSVRSAIGSSGDLDATGVLSIVRHPWYVAVFILLWTSDLTGAAITVNVVLSAYLVVGTILEEGKLLAEYGDEYRLYQDKVSMFIPIKWFTASRT